MKVRVSYLIATYKKGLYVQKQIQNWFAIFKDSYEVGNF